METFPHPVLDTGLRAKSVERAAGPRKLHLSVAMSLARYIIPTRCSSWREGARMMSGMRTSVRCSLVSLKVGQSPSFAWRSIVIFMILLRQWRAEWEWKVSVRSARRIEYKLFTKQKCSKNVQSRKRFSSILFSSFMKPSLQVHLLFSVYSLKQKSIIFFVFNYLDNIFSNHTFLFDTLRLFDHFFVVPSVVVRLNASSKSAPISSRHLTAAVRTRFAEGQAVCSFGIQFVICYVFSSEMASRALIRGCASGISKSYPGYATYLQIWFFRMLRKINSITSQFYITFIIV